MKRQSAPQILEVLGGDRLFQERCSDLGQFLVGEDGVAVERHTAQDEAWPEPERSFFWRRENGRKNELRLGWRPLEFRQRSSLITWPRRFQASQRRSLGTGSRYRRY